MSENLTPPIRLSYRRRAILDKLVTSDEAAQILAREEAATLEARRKLITERDALPAKAAAAEKAAAKRMSDANARFEAARRELKAADEEVKAAQSAVMAADPSRRVFEIDRELKRTADNRLSDMRFELNRIHDSHLPALYRVVDLATPSIGLGRGARLSTNLPEIKAAREAIGTATTRLAELELAALTRREITEALLLLIEDLRAPLGAFSLVPPGLNPDDDWEVESQSNRDYLDLVGRLKRGAEAAAA